MTMLYLLGGNNTYASSRRLKELKNEFIEKNNGVVDTHNIDEYDSAEKILTTIDSLPLFSQPQLVIIKRLLSAKKEIIDKMTSFIKTKPKINIIFWEDKNLDKRTSIYKEIKKRGVFEEFASLKYPKLKAWISAQLKKHILFDPECIDILIFKVGEDQTQLVTIIQNLILLCESQNKKRLTTDNIHEFVAKTTEESIWDFVDAIGENNKPKALKITEELLTEKSDFMKIIGMLAREFRIMSQVACLHNKGRSYQKIVATLKLHPFVIRKALSHIQNFPQERIKKIYQKLMKTDLVVKEGKFEEKLALDLLITAL